MAIKNNIPQKRKPSQGNGLVWFLIIGLFFVELLAYTWIRTESRHTLLRVSEARAVLSKKLDYKQSLLVERDRLKSEERIIRIARTRLNLIGEGPDQTIYLEGDEG